MVESFEMGGSDSPDSAGVYPSTGAASAPASPPTNAQLILRAVEAHFMAKRSRSVANLNNYLTNSAGIGEHPDVVEECIKLIDDIEHSEGALATLSRVVSS
tara:strand:- start:983 stop:1285 length:303 start_codon:yes stop_codon:yes gene_type:complete